jgi:antitoxin Phd
MKRISSKTPAWQLQTAKNHFSELFRRARAEGPQYVTDAEKETVVVVSAEQFEKLVAQSRRPASLVKFFRTSPLAGARLDLERDPDCGRDIEL